MAPHTILLVEDDYFNRRLTKKVLLNAGYQILEAKDAIEAINILDQRHADLAILDINLGEDKLDGISLGRKIAAYYKLPFIYLTAYASLPVFRDASTSKPASYLTKPLKEIDLIASIEIAISQYASNVEKTNISSIVVKSEDHFVDLSITSIDYIEAKGNYLICYCGEKTYRYRSTIKQFLALSLEITFIQTHRAFLVNKEKIEKFNSTHVFLNNKPITISRNFRKNIFSI